MQGEREREGVRRRRVVSKHTGSHFSSQGSFFTMKFFSLSFFSFPIAVFQRLFFVSSLPPSIRDSTYLVFTPPRLLS